MDYNMLLTTKEKDRVKEIMRNISINKNHISRKQLREYKHEFRLLLRKYNNKIDFNFIHITK